MSYTIFFARFFGLYLVLTAIAMFVRKTELKAMLDDYAKSPALVMMAGMINIFIGLWVILLHNVWQGWPIVITLIGWLSLLRGLIRYYAPRNEKGLTHSMVEGNQAVAWAFVALVVGAFLTYQGFAC